MTNVPADPQCKPPVPTESGPFEWCADGDCKHSRKAHTRRGPCLLCQCERFEEERA